MTTQTSHHQPFRIWDAGLVNGRALLRLGGRWVALDQVSSYGVCKVVERDTDGLMLNFSLFGLMAAGVVVPVVHNVLAPKFLIAAFLLGAIALMSLCEVIFAKPIVTYEIDLVLSDGEALNFTSGNLEDINGILAVLAHGASISQPDAPAPDLAQAA